MKLRKQIMAVVTVFTVLASLFPAGIAVSAQADNTVFTEDFESYEVGTIVEATANQTSATRIGDIEFQLQSGDKLEIAQENGNKYLKITRPSQSATNSHIKYYFPEIYSNGKYAISFDFRPDVHSRHFARFGSFIRTSGINLTTISYGNSFYANGSTNNSYYIANLFKTANYTGAAYATVTQTIDLTSANDNYTCNAVYPGSSGTAEKTVTNTANQLGIKGLAWAIQKNTNNNYNGPDDASSAAVYRIDNIKVETVPGLELASANAVNNGSINSTKPFTMTFSEAVNTASVTLSKDGAAMSSTDYTVTVSGETVSVIPTGGWENGSVYTVNVGAVTAVSGSTPYSGATYTLTGSESLFTEDFEGYPVGVISSGTAVDTVTGAPPVRNPGGLCYNLAAGDTLEVVEKDGSKALKITIDSTDASTTRAVYLDFDENYGGNNAYEVGFDYYVENNSVWLPDFGTINDDRQSNAYYVHNTSFCPIKRVSSYSKSLYFDGTTTTYYGGNLVRSSDAIWRHQNTAIDFSQSPRPFTITTTNAGNGAQLATKSMTLNTELNDISSILWRFKKHATATWNGPDSGDSVFYIDNITVKSITLDLTNTSVQNNGKVSGTNPFVMTFSGTVASASVTLQKDGEEMDSGDYSVAVSGGTVSVVPADGWEDGSTYTVNVGTVTASGLAPFEGTTFTLYGNNSLFSEDFESYPIGVIATGPANTVSTTRNPGGLSYKLIEGDTLEIVEKDGSKVLKLTTLKNDTAGTERRLLLDFDQHYGDGKAYDVSFDYYVENNSVWFGDFGTLCDDKISGHSDYVHTAYYAAIKPISSYRDNLYFDRNTKKYYGGGLLAASDEFWKQQNTTIDFSQDPKPFTVKTTKLSDGTRLAKESMTVSQTYGKQTVDNISSIAWNFKTNATSAWNGQDEGSGVYYIDNIKVKTVKLALLGSNIESGDTISIDTDINLEFNASVGAGVADYISILKNDELLSDTEYSVSLSEDCKTVTISSANGWDYDSTYILGIEGIETSGFDPFDGALIEFCTPEYDDTVPPNIVSSTIANGADNVDYRTESVILSTNGVILDETTITKQNIKLYKNGSEISSYSVAPQGKYAVKVSFSGLEKDTSYTVSVSGLMSDGTNPLAMTKNFVLSFEAVGDIYADNIVLSRTEESNIFNFSARLNNNTEGAQSYQPILALINKSSGEIEDVKFATSGTLAAGENSSISISGINADLDSVDLKLMLWDSISGIEPVTGKKSVKKLNIGTTVIFANYSKIVVADGEPYEEETVVQKTSSGFVIPQSLASKYLGINSALTEADIANRGIGYFVSERYDFIAVGDNVVFDAQAEENAIKKFGIYVSPTGDDANSGYSSAPVKTLARAVKIYEDGNKQPILMHAGTYRMSEAVVLKSNSKDGGMTIKDFGDGEVILSGAVELPKEEFTAVTDSTVLNKIPSGARSYVKQISLADYVDGEMSAYREYTPQQVSDAYYELFAGDSVQTIARYPNEGFLTTSGVSGNSFTAPSSSKASLWKSADSGIIAGYFKYNWAFEDIYINKSSGGSSTITLNSAPKYGLEDGQRYYAMNMLEELDAPGEYYIDNNAKILYYYPTSSFTSVNPELSIMNKTDITETYSKNCMIYISSVSNVKISGITFEKTRGSGIVTSGGSYISIDGCTLKNIGNTAVTLASSDSEVVNSTIYAIGGRGITAEAGSNTALTDGNITIADNTIYNFGRIFKTYQGAIHLLGCGNTAEYNTIYNAPHCAIRFSGSNHKIKHNIIHDVVKETSDAGAIYAGRDWTSWGTAISSNYFYNIKNNVGDSSTNQAIYIDDLMCGTTVSNNVIKDSDCAALFGGGRGNTFKNNIVANCNIGIKYDNRGENTSAGQLVRGQLSDGSDTVLEAFVKFLQKDSVIATMTERDAFNGFTKLVSEVNSSDSKLAYPKSAVITGNNFYGSKVNNSGYLDLHEHVTNYGTYSGNNKSTSVPSYDLPECGTRN